MQLIGMLDSPYVRRVAVALIAAQVPFEHKPISLFRHIDAFSAINPLLKAPTLVGDDGTVLVEFDPDPRLSRRALSGSRRANPNGPGGSGPVAAADRPCACGDGEGGAAALRARLASGGQARQPWVDRVMGQLHQGLGALDREPPETGWIAGDLGLADIAAVCAYGFVAGTVGDLVDVGAYRNLAAFSARAEALAAFRAAPAEDGVAAPVAV